VAALDDEGLFNFRRLSPTLTTSGQPSEAQFAAIRDAGIGTVINLALTDSPRALPDEPGTLAALGLRYIHIPVDFNAPSEGDFERFGAALAELGDAPVHIHCAANYRVSAFLYRYRVSALGWSDAEASMDLLAVWEPNETWQTFIARTPG
jgi:protein tyrosine phosphatase (PTP) superfamily phosphohydrolase (DUF442 family)